MTLLGWKNLFHLYLNMRFLSAVKSVVRLSTGIGSSLAMPVGEKKSKPLCDAKKSDGFGKTV